MDHQCRWASKLCSILTSRNLPERETRSLELLKYMKDHSTHGSSEPHMLQQSRFGGINGSVRVGSYGVPGYVTTEILYASQSRSVDVIIQRGYALNNPEVKVICKGSGQMDEVANRRIEHEYDTLKYLYSKAMTAKDSRSSEILTHTTHSHSFIPRPIEIVKDRGVWTLVVEDVGGLSLRKFQDLYVVQNEANMITSPDEGTPITKRKLPLEMILNIALQIVEALKLTITAGVIHKDINPDNIVVVSLPEGDIAVQLIDFNLASIVVSNDPPNNDCNGIQGTVAYMAPEQTGRLQRSADFRSDFYSLGLTLWELLLGRPAFHFNDVMEYMHAHIAIEIEAPSKVDPSIPESISAIVQKLIKKSPDARYQSIYGLKYDLNDCLKTISEFKKLNGQDLASPLLDNEIVNAFKVRGPFEIGTKDCSKTINIPKGKLYGRSAEQELLLGYVHKLLGSPSDMTNFILVIGERGMGSNSLLSVARSKITETNNFCVSGSYSEGCLPLQGILQALQQFIGMLLSSQTEILEYYVAKIKSNLGAEIPRLETVLPDLRLIYSNNSVPLTEDRSRIVNYPELVSDIVVFIKVITSCEKAVAFCLKDIETADDESFQVLAHLANCNTRCLVILTSSDSESVSSLVATPFQNVVGQQENNFHYINLKPLSLADIQELLEDTVTPSLSPIHNLSALIERKTFGTPAYIHQFLIKAELKGLLWFDEDETECGWNWDVNTLDKNIEVSESVLKDMTKRINSLSPESRNILENAVCIGQIFDVRLLSLLLNQKTASTTNMLWDFLKAGFIKPIPFSESKGPWKDVALDGVAFHPAGAIIEYKFAFETVYEEIYQSLSSSVREKAHLKIARILHAIGISKAVASNEIEICKHYNLAIDIVSDQEEMKLISSLNLQAAELAMSDFDFDSAKAFLTKGIAILNELGHPWLPTDSLYFNLNLQMAKCLIVDGDLMDARHVLKTMETHSLSKCHIYKVFYLQRHLDAMFGDFKAVLEEGRSNLRDLGIHIPTTSEGCKKLALEHFQFCQSTLENKSVSDVIASVRMADEESDMIQAIILIVSFAAYRSATKPLFSMLIAMGCHKSLADGFGRSSCALWMAYPCLSFYLLEQPSFKSIDTSQMMADAVTQFFPDKSQEFEVIYKILCGHTLLLSNSQTVEMIEALIQNARHSGHNLTMNTLSLHLISSAFSYGRSISWLRSHLLSQREILLASNSQAVSMIDHLMQRVESIVSGEPMQSVDEPLIHVFDIIQAMIYDKPELHISLSNARAGDRCLPVVKLIELMFFDCILLSNQYHAADKERDSIRIKLNETVNAMKCYMARGFVDAVGKRSLMLAELERINENVVAAIAHYEAAIEEFKQTGSLLFEAFALERFAAMFHGIGMKKMAQMCFTECVKKWTEYGSEGKRVHVIGKFKSLYGSAEAAIFDAVCRMNQKPVPENGFSYTITRKGSISPSNSSNSRSFCHSSRFGDSQTTNGTANLDIDVTTTLKVAQSIREETSLDSLLRKIMRYVMVNTGATKGALVLNDTSRLMIEAIAEFSENQESIDVLQSHPITNQVHGYRLPLSVIYYAFRTRKSLVLTDPTNDATHGNDTYIKEFRPQSILCCPIINQSTVTGVVYLENKLQGAAFTPKRIEIIQALMPTASVYIKNAKLTKTNTELTEALKDSGNAPNVPKYKIDAPVQRAIDVLQSLKSRMTAQGDPAVRQIDFIMMSLTSSDLFMSSIDEINDENGRGIDQDTKNWIENSLLQKSSKPSKGPENDGEAMFVVGNRRPTVVSVPEEGSHESLNVGSGSPRILPRAMVQNNEEINLFLEGSMDFDFDVFKLGELTNGQPLYYLSMHLLQYYGLIEHFNIDIEVAKTFFREVEANYRNLSYHNSYHAADVLQTVNLLLLSDPQMAQNFTKLEILAACIASAVHDVDHPGVNNNYLIQSSHPLAILYNDLSVLEYHHASKAFEIMQKPQTNIFAKFPADQKRDVRKQMINMVIATDMSQHFTYINKLKSKISAAALKLQEAADRALVLDMAIKCADLNNPAKSLESCKSWCYRIMEEFFQQGDRERLNGLNVSMFMDRKDTNIPKCQIGFIDILVAPLFESWSQCIATDFTRICMKNISLNRSHWESILDKPDAIPAFQPPDLHLLEQELFTTVGSPATLKKKLISMQKGGTEHTSDSFRQRSKTSSIAGKNARTSPIPNKSNALSSSKNYPKQGYRVDGKSQTILAKGEGSIEDVARNFSGKPDPRSQGTPITPKMGRRTSAVVEMINPIKPSAIGFNLPELPKSDNSANALNTSNNE